MNRRNAGPLYLLVLTFGTVLSSQVLRAPMSPPAVGSRAGLPANRRGPPPARKDPCEHEDPGAACAEAEIEKEVARLGYGKQFLFVTLPDPIRSRTGWLFDSRLDAIQRALETGGWVMHRYLLPWVSLPDSDRRSSNCNTHPRPRGRPGMVIFRLDESRETLVLFIVGETPTEGYALVKLFGAYSFGSRRSVNTLTVRLDNATNELYRNHLNYLKDLAAEMGRTFKVVFSTHF